MSRLLPVPLLLAVFFVHSALGIAMYDEGRLEIDGVQLFQDSENRNAYYYLPPYPSVSVRETGEFEFLCTKYVGREGQGSSGGLFHVLVHFSLTPDQVSNLEIKLREIYPKARIAGAVPMMEIDETGTAPGFRIVSTILNTEGKTPFTTQLITSGRAPFLPGSKAAIAAHLTADGATLLWDSFQGATSDVSIVVEGFFRAKTRAYKATVKADLELVYNHFSSFKNSQGGFTRDQASSILDSLCQEGLIRIDVADLSAGLGVQTEVYQNLLNIITEKVVSSMFDVKNGWAKPPATETAAHPTDLKERYQRGAFVRFFAGDGSQEYVPDNQLVLKKKSEIRSFHFSLDLNHSTVIKVPVHATGNIRGFYNEYKDDKRYFRVVDMNDPDFQTREIHFQIDGNFIETFGDIIDQVSVMVEKDYHGDDTNSFNGTLSFNKQNIDSGRIIQSVIYQRLGDRSDEWLNYKYKVGWKFIGIDTVITVPGEGWLKSSLPSVSLQPPMVRNDIEIGLDEQTLKKQGIQSIRIRFASMLFSKPYQGRTIVIRPGEVTDVIKTPVYHDKDQPIVYQINWYTNKQTRQDDLKVLDDEFLFLVPPQM